MNDDQDLKLQLQNWGKSNSSNCEILGNWQVSGPDVGTILNCKKFKTGSNWEFLAILELLSYLLPAFDTILGYY